MIQDEYLRLPQQELKVIMRFAKTTPGAYTPKTRISNPDSTPGNISLCRELGVVIKVWLFSLDTVIEVWSWTLSGWKPVRISYVNCSGKKQQCSICDLKMTNINNISWTLPWKQTRVDQSRSDMAKFPQPNNQSGHCILAPLKLSGQSTFLDEIHCKMD